MASQRLGGGSRATAPIWLSVVSAFMALASIAVLSVTVAQLPAIPVVLTVIGYVTGAILCMIAASFYRASRDSRRSRPDFRVTRGWDKLVTVSVTVGIVAGLANAILLATELAK